MNTRFLDIARCSLVIRSGPHQGQSQMIEGDVFRIGKSPENDLVLDDDTVSRAHCEIARERRGYLLRDLASTNGTWLDGAGIREIWLKPESLITIGKVEIEVRPWNERIELVPSENDHFGDVVGTSVGMRQIFGLLERLGPTDATVLLSGEAGTGKSALACAIHESSPRKREPFVVVDCRAVASTLIESELFGQGEESTDANEVKHGAFERAHGGTLFLDQIDELPLHIQPKLLRALEQRSFRRVGGHREIRVNIRVIAASTRNLEMEVERGKFYEELYFRLAAVPIELPPLRERREDIPLLIDRLNTSRATHKEMLALFQAHDWPGNVRELLHLLEHIGRVARTSPKVDTVELSTER